MFNLLETNFFSQTVLGTFDTIEEIKAKYDFYLIEEDEDFPGNYDAIDKQGRVYQVEAA